jgi:hypothetical protein
MLLDQTAELKMDWGWRRIMGKTCGAGSVWSINSHGRSSYLWGGNPSTRSGRGDDLDSISNLQQTRRIATDFGKGINSVWKTLCGYERCQVRLRLLAGWTGSVKEGVRRAVLGYAALCANGRLASTGPCWAAPEWGGEGMAVGSGSASGRVSAHSQFSI